MSNIFYNVEPKIINTELACLVGLNEAIVLQQFHYWIEKNKTTGTNCIDGHVWTYGTIQEYRDRDFRFWSVDTVKRTIGSLVKRNFLIKGNYNKMKMDHTNWYAVNYTAIAEWINQNAFTSTEEYEKAQSNSAKCPDRTVQNTPIEEGKMPQAIQENKKQKNKQENKKYINNNRLNNKTNTENLPCESENHTFAGKNANIPAEKQSEEQVIKGEIINHTEQFFEQFWDIYPRKENEHQAKKAWQKLNPDQELFNLIANALEYRIQTKEWQAENGRYIPHPARWLNDRRWEDRQSPQKLNNTAQDPCEDVLLNGKPLDPVQRKQMEYIEQRVRAGNPGGEK